MLALQMFTWGGDSPLLLLSRAPPPGPHLGLCSDAGWGSAVCLSSPPPHPAVIKQTGGGGGDGGKKKPFQGHMAFSPPLPKACHLLRF